MTCEEIRRDAAGLAALSRSDPERREAEAHAVGCPDCATALHRGDRLMQLLALGEAPAPSPEALRRAAASVLAELVPLPPYGRLIVPVFVAAAAVVVVFTGHERSAEPAHWTAAVLAAAVAVCVGAGFWRGRYAAAAAIVASAAFALLVARGGGLEPRLGAICSAVELAAAAAPLLAALFLLHRGAPLGPGELAAAAAAGALAGQAGLHLTCEAGPATPHLLAFHVVGVLVAAAIGALMGVAPRRRAPV